MFKTLLVICLLLAAGCLGRVENTYVEGTSFQVGLYIPLNGTLYGIQMVNFLSGKRIVCPTNGSFKVESEHFMSNSALGVFDIVEDNETKVNL